MITCYICDSRDCVRMENKIWLCQMHRRQFAKNMRTLEEAKQQAAEVAAEVPVLAKEQTTDPLPEKPIVTCRQCNVPFYQYELDENMTCNACLGLQFDSSFFTISGS